MGKTGIAVFVGVAGFLVGAVAVFMFLDWGTSNAGQELFVDPTRADYVDFFLSFAAALFAAVSAALTMGAIAIGVIALRTLRTIKDEAADAASSRVDELVPLTLAEMAQQGMLDEPLERATMQKNVPEPDDEGTTNSVGERRGTYL